jgi:hypothetical protein
MTTPKSGIHDGIISGVLTLNKTCANCGSAVWAVKIETITLPTGLKPGPTLIAFDGKKPVNILGITCGCYAKFHRQVAHIQGRSK